MHAYSYDKYIYLYIYIYIYELKQIFLENVKMLSSGKLKRKKEMLSSNNFMVVFQHISS